MKFYFLPKIQMNIIQVQNKSELDILKDKKSSFEGLKFEFSEKYIQSLKDNLDLKNSVQLVVKDARIFVVTYLDMNMNFGQVFYIFANYLLIQIIKGKESEVNY